MKYDVTIGIPVYRSVDYIRKTIMSALSQTYQSIEFLIVDDAGCDGSIEIVHEFKYEHPRGNDIRVISHDKNLGVSLSRNQIIDEAQGEYLFFLDSDDTIFDNTISLLIQNLREYNAEIVFGSYVKVDISGRREVYQYPALKLLEKDSLASFAYRKYGGVQASACNFLVKTALLRNHKHYFIQSNYWEDLVFTFDLVTLIERAVLLPDITYSYICRVNSLSHYQQRDQVSKDEIMMNIMSIEHLKLMSFNLCNKQYYPNRCYNIVMTDFYMACNILKRRSDIYPFISNREIKDMMRHPATWSQILLFKHSRLKNIFLYVIGKMPSWICVVFIWNMGKIKKLI